MLVLNENSALFYQDFIKQAFFNTKFLLRVKSGLCPQVKSYLLI